MKSSLPLVEQKEITGSSRVAFEKSQFGKHIIVSAIEHPAVKESALWLKNQGFEIDFAPVDEKGFVDVEALADLIRPDTTLVSIMAVTTKLALSAH